MRSHRISSGGFQVALCHKIKNIARSGRLQWISSRSLSENLWISPDFFDFMVGSSGLGFLGGNLPTDPKGSGSMGGNLLPTIGLVDSGGGGSVSSGSDGLSG